MRVSWGAKERLHLGAMCCPFRGVSGKPSLAEGLQWEERLALSSARPPLSLPWVDWKRQSPSLRQQRCREVLPGLSWSWYEAHLRGLAPEPSQGPAIAFGVISHHPPMPSLPPTPAPKGSPGAVGGGGECASPGCLSLPVNKLWDAKEAGGREKQIRAVPVLARKRPGKQVTQGASEQVGEMVAGGPPAPRSWLTWRGWQELSKPGSS